MSGMAMRSEAGLRMTGRLPLILGLVLGLTACAPRLARQDAVAVAERFVRANGYTDAPDREIKLGLDQESIDVSTRTEQIEIRRNTLRPNAIGVKTARNGHGWGVAFEYVSNPNSCRIVTMNGDGSGILIEHKDGVREYWAGFDAP